MNYQDAMKAVESGKPVFSNTMGGAIVKMPGIPVAFIPSAGAIAAGAPAAIGEHVATPAFEAADDWFIPGEQPDPEASTDTQDAA